MNAFPSWKETFSFVLKIASKIFKNIVVFGGNKLESFIVIVSNPWHQYQGSKLGGAGSRGLPWILLQLPQILGSPKMY